jgi:hypothetical protein
MSTFASTAPAHATGALGRKASDYAAGKSAQKLRELLAD